MPKLVLVRHGHSLWNVQSRLTGSVNVPLAPLGEKEARETGRRLKGIGFEVAFSSEQRRAIDTLAIILDELGQKNIPSHKDSALNERRLGKLEGLTLEGVASKFGAAQLKLFQTSYDYKPPKGESLSDVADRTLPFLILKIFPLIQQGKDVLVVAHLNTLRIIMMAMEGVPQNKIRELQLPPGKPLIYSYESNKNFVRLPLTDLEERGEGAPSPADAAERRGGDSPLVIKDWDDYERIAKHCLGRFEGLYRQSFFDYVHPVRLQHATPLRYKKPYTVRAAYSEWGDRSKPTVICCGGVANCAMRFNYLAHDLRHDFRVICMDWLGRGLSGWMADQGDYSFDTGVEQLKQMIEHLDSGPVTIIGSSLGGRTAMALTAKYPHLVQKLILNDTGPHHPRSRHRRRSAVLGRFYVFKDPSELLRRVGASQKNDGPISDSVRFYLTYHLTRWSDSDGGRIYRHDMRAMEAYKQDVASLELWKEWAKIRCPVLVIHGMLSEVLLPKTIEKMKKTKALTVVHVPNTGHTPVLCDRNQTRFIKQWLDNPAVSDSVLEIYLPEPLPEAEPSLK